MTHFLEMMSRRPLMVWAGAFVLLAIMAAASGYLGATPVLAAFGQMAFLVAILMAVISLLIATVLGAQSDLQDGGAA